jgi:hypothetical protein
MGAAEYVPVGPGYVPRPHPRLGRLAGLVAQPGLGGPSFRWTPSVEPEFVDLCYQIVGGREGGRQLEGSLRTFLRPPDVEWATIERLASEHLASLAAGYPDETPPAPAPDAVEASDAQPSWERIVIRVDDARLSARLTIHRGFEGVAFRIGDRISSSAFSVFDASVIDARYRTLYAPWPDPQD